MSKMWDQRFLDMVDLVGSWSKDPSTKVGAVIVREDKTIASVGYNGFPRGMDDNEALYADRPTKYSRIVHGEMNAILNAHGTVNGNTLYVPMLCCDRCAVHVIQAGITRVVCREPSDDMQSRWGDAFEQTRAMFAEAGVDVTEYPLEDQPSRELNTVAKRQDYARIRITMPSVDGKRIAQSVADIDVFMMKLSNGVDLSTDQARIDHLTKVAKAASLTLMGVK